MQIQELFIGSVISDGKEPFFVQEITIDPNFKNDQPKGEKHLLHLSKGIDLPVCKILPLNKCTGEPFTLEYALKFGFKKHLKQNHFFYLYLNGVSFEYNQYFKTFYCSDLKPPITIYGALRRKSSEKNFSVNYVQNAVYQCVTT